MFLSFLSVEAIAKALFKLGAMLAWVTVSSGTISLQLQMLIAAAL